MKQIRVLLLLAAFFATATSWAQLKIGVKAGPALSRAIRVPSPGAQDFERVGWQAGLFTNLALSEHWTLQPNLLLSSRGLRTTANHINGNTGEVIGKIHYSARPLYVEVPVLALYKIALSRSVKVYAGAGPYVAVGIGGVWTNDAPGIFDRAESPIDYGRYRNFSRYDLGASGAVGVELGRQTQIGLNYNLGLTNPNQFRNRMLGLTLGYVFERPATVR